MIVIPMAGQSSRFKTAGYHTHKYMLEAGGRSLFEHSVLSFEKYFSTEKFLFITLAEHDSKKFICDKCDELGIENYDVVTLDTPTLGQAHTVYLGLKQVSVCEDEHILIFNIDTFRSGFEYPAIFNLDKIDGYLETFIGSGKNWSNVLPRSNTDNTVELTAEKQEISEYCCTGIYYFRSVRIFMGLLQGFASLDDRSESECELYIAPLYNQLIRDGLDIRYTVISSEEVVFCGVPEEYLQYLESVNNI